MKKTYEREREAGYGWKVVLTNVCGVGSESWVTNEDVICLLSREEFAVDNFVL